MPSEPRNAIRTPRRAIAGRMLASLATCAAALATLGFPGCPADLTRPGAGAGQAPSMSNYWPNEDGRSWTYRATTRQLEPESFDFVAPDEPVRAVTLADVRALLADDVAARSGATVSYRFRMRFQGQVTTKFGVTAQNLVESFPAPRGGGEALPAAPFEGRFLARLAEARPDLRARLAHVHGGPGSQHWEWTPYFVHGYAFVKGPEHVGGYGDADTLLAWKFLDSGTRPGHTFRHQLVPSLTDDVWLHARVERRVRVEVAGEGVLDHALEVIYLVDYGVATFADTWGTVLGHYRIFDYGRVVYAPGVGPVADLERRLAYLGRGVTHGVAELDLALESCEPGRSSGPALAAAKR